MLEEMKDLPGNVVGLVAKGRVDRDDYQRVVWPIVEQAKREGRHLRLLYQLGPEFEGFSAAALLEDARVGLRNLSLMDRVAVVSDVVPIRKFTQLLEPLMPCAVRVFANQDRTAAIDWLSHPAEQKGMTHRLLRDEGVVVVKLLSPLATETFEALALTVDNYLASHDRLEGLVIEAHSRPSWENLGSFVRHLSFVRDHHRKIGRVALVADAPIARAAATLAARVLGPEVESFPTSALDAAIRWAGAGRGKKDAGADVKPFEGIDRVHEAGLESFPASDPPSFTR
jgi:hypothetical protein